MNDLREGYYWVKEVINSRWEIMRLEDGYFTDTYEGYNELFDVDEIYKIGDRIDEPK